MTNYRAVTVEVSRVLLSDVDCLLWIRLCADKPLSTYIQQQSLDHWTELDLRIETLA